MAKLVPVPETPAILRPPRVLGIDAGKQFWISEDFDDSLPEAVLRSLKNEPTAISVVPTN